MLDVAVRYLHLSELPKAIHLIQEVFLETEASDLTAKAKDSFLQMLKAENFLKFLQEEQAVYLGYFGEDGSLLGILFAQNCYLSHLYVTKRGKGIGKALYRFFEEVMASRMEESSTILLNATRSAVPFYGSLGFRVKGEAIMIFGIPFIPMEKKLRKDLID